MCCCDCFSDKGKNSDDYFCTTTRVLRCISILYAFVLPANFTALYLLFLVLHSYSIFLTGKFHDFHFYILSPEFRFFSEFLICSSLVREIARGGLLTSVIGEKRGLIMCFWLFLGCAKKNKTSGGVLSG